MFRVCGLGFRSVGFRGVGVRGFGLSVQGLGGRWGAQGSIW